MRTTLSAWIQLVDSGEGMDGEKAAHAFSDLKYMVQLRLELPIISLQHGEALISVFRGNMSVATRHDKLT